MSDYECPHCGQEYNAVGNHEDDTGGHNCDECGGDFIVTIDYVAEYYAEAIDHVSPDDKKRNDAMERGDEMRDRAKDEKQ